MKRLVLLALCLVLAVTGFTGCKDSRFPEGKVLKFSDMQLTLPGDFADLSQEGIDADADFLYGRKSLIVKGAAEEKSKLQEMTLEQYTALVISGNQLQCTPQAMGKGYQFTYETLAGGQMRQAGRKPRASSSRTISFPLRSAARARMPD